MAQQSAGYHESEDILTSETKEFHRATVSLMEELEAMDWYNQRIDATTDPELRAILIHNRDEEKEHAALLLEWMRRKDAKLDEELRDKLFTSVSLAEKAAEEEAELAQPGTAETGSYARGAARGDGSLGMGSLRR